MRYTKTLFADAPRGRARQPPPAQPLGTPDPSRRQLQGGQDEADAALDAASAWLVNLEAGRIQVR